MKKIAFKIAFIIVSLLGIALSDPIDHPYLSFLASGLHFGLFFYQIQTLAPKWRFFASAAWYGTLQAMQFSWFATTTYHGPLILVAYAILLVLLAAQFGLFSLLVNKYPLSLIQVLALAGVWTLFEWIRLHFMAGFVWNPIGLSLCWHELPMQLASYIGVYGLSFIVMTSNLLFLNVLNRTSNRHIAYWSVSLVLPLLIGCVKLALHSGRVGKVLNVAAVQTGLSVDEKTPFLGHNETFIHPIAQWENHLELLKGKKELDLIVFPESVSLFGVTSAVYPMESIVDMMKSVFGSDILSHMPHLDDVRFAQKSGDGWFLSNAFIGQTLANYFDADIIMGLDDSHKEKSEYYNAAFHFSPNASTINRYIKQVLVPISEYLPSFLSPSLARQFGITDFFTPGAGAEVFQGKIPLSMSICYEECFGHLMRQNRQKGTQIFINVTNDGWFPKSRLPHAHFIHARLRSLEMGVPMVRASNTGETAILDSFGKICDRLVQFDEKRNQLKGVAEFRLNSYSYKTLYTYWGDGFICLFSLAMILLYYSPLLIPISLLRKRRKIRLE